MKGKTAGGKEKGRRNKVAEGREDAAGEPRVAVIERTTERNDLTLSSVSYFGALGDDLASLSLNILVRKVCLMMLCLHLLTSEAVSRTQRGTLLSAWASLYKLQMLLPSLWSRWRTELYNASEIR